MVCGEELCGVTVVCGFIDESRERLITWLCRILFGYIENTLMRRSRIRVFLFAVVEVVVGEGIFHEMLGYIEIIG